MGIAVGVGTKKLADGRVSLYIDIYNNRRVPPPIQLLSITCKKRQEYTAKAHYFHDSRLQHHLCPYRGYS